MLREQPAADGTRILRGLIRGALSYAADLAGNPGITA